MKDVENRSRGNEIRKTNLIGQFVRLTQVHWLTDRQLDYSLSAEIGLQWNLHDTHKLTLHSDDGNTAIPYPFNGQDGTDISNNTLEYLPLYLKIFKAKLNNSSGAQ